MALPGVDENSQTSFLRLPHPAKACWPWATPGALPPVPLRLYTSFVACLISCIKYINSIFLGDHTRVVLQQACYFHSIRRHLWNGFFWNAYIAQTGRNTTGTDQGTDLFNSFQRCFYIIS